MRIGMGTWIPEMLWAWLARSGQRINYFSEPDITPAGLAGRAFLAVPAVIQCRHDVAAFSWRQVRSWLVMFGGMGKYPKPPFKQQDQPWPALAGKMHPKPDHGETSYRGSGRLNGRKALITGGDSGMGRAAAIAYAREGADVAINYFPNEEEDAREVIQLIEQAGRKGMALPGDLRVEAFCTQLVADAVA